MAQDASAAVMTAMPQEARLPGDMRGRSNSRRRTGTVVNPRGTGLLGSGVSRTAASTAFFASRSSEAQIVHMQASVSYVNRALATSSLDDVLTRLGLLSSANDRSPRSPWTLPPSTTSGSLLSSWPSPSPSCVPNG